VIRRKPAGSRLGRTRPRFSDVCGVGGVRLPDRIRFRVVWQSEHVPISLEPIARDDTRASCPAPARRLFATTSRRASRAFASSTVCRRRACRASCGPRGDAGNNPCRRQGDVVVVWIIDVEKRAAESASAFRTNADATREPIARCTPAGCPKRRRGGQAAACLRSRLAVRKRATRRAVRSRVVQSRASVLPAVRSLTVAIR
jgi:hypothetical protein